ncbi:MAG: META domain-containing protein [Hyphomonadaceae bacterium]
MYRRAALALAALLTASCAQQAPSELDGAWQVQEIAGASLNADERIHFSVEGETMRGSTGCNDFTASVSQFSGSISIGNVVESDGVCPSEAAQTNEARFLGVLPSVTRFARHGASLDLLGDPAQPDALITARSDTSSTQ